MKEFLFKLLVAVAGVLAPIKALMLSVGFLIFADLVTGLWAAVKDKVPVTSAGMRRTISKILVYQLAVISGFLVEHYMLTDFLPISKIVATVIGLVELKSVLENSNKILGYNLFKTVIAKLGSENEQLKEDIKKQVKDAVEEQLK
jgi:hypothetical protein